MAKVFALRKFTLNLNNKPYEFVAGQEIKGKVLFAIRKDHYTRGMVADSAAVSSIGRRLEGRNLLHAQLGTDPTTDIEREVLRVVIENLFDENLRDMGRSQTSFINGLLGAVKKEFANRSEEEWVDGNDDFTTKRQPEGGRSIIWAKPNVINEAIAFTINYIDNKF